MAIEGSLVDVSLADICQLLALGRKTGCLTITDRSDFGYIYFKAGRVIHASVLNRPDRLGELLVKNGVIQQSVLDQAVDDQGREFPRAFERGGDERADPRLGGQAEAVGAVAGARGGGDRTQSDDDAVHGLVLLGSVAGWLGGSVAGWLGGWVARWLGGSVAR